MRLGDDFDWLEVGHSANQEALVVSLRGSWMLCTTHTAKFTKIQQHYDVCSLDKLLYILQRRFYIVPIVGTETNCLG